MDAKCTDGFLFHRWTYDYTCGRCGITGHVRGSPSSEKWADDLSESALLSPAHPVDRQVQHDSHQDFLDAASTASAGSHGTASLDLPAFLRRPV